MKIQRPPSRQHIPDDAERVFHGVMYDVFQWQQKRFDGSMATYERLRRPDSVVIIPVTNEGKIIVAQEEQPGTSRYWTMPCGNVEHGEAPDVAAKRELLEETGLVPAELEFWFAHQVENRVDWAIFVFFARGCTKIAQPEIDAGERMEIKEVTFDEWLHVVIRDDFQNVNLGTRLLKALLVPEEMVLLKKRLGISEE